MSTIKCIVKNCENHDNQGSGIYFDGETGNRIWFCYPCWTALATCGGGVATTQVYRNMIEVHEKIDDAHKLSRKGRRALELVLDELAAAEKKFPWWPDDQIHAASIIAEESGELTQAANNHVFKYDENPGSVPDMRKEAKQTGAMALRFLIGLAGGYEKTKPEGK